MKRNILIFIFLVSIKTPLIAQLMGGLMIPSKPLQFVLSGGIETSVGTETLLTFNNSGTLNITGSGQARILVVGAGGGGKSGKSNNGNIGGGGGRVIEQFLTLSPGTYNVTIGNGGTANGGNGGASNISGITLTANGGLGNGTSGTGFIIGSALSGLWGAAATCFTSSDGAGASGNGQAGVGAGPGIDNDITGAIIQYGYGGGGGHYDGSLSYTCLQGNGAGYISYNNGNPPIPVNATPNAQNRGHGGNGGGNTSTLTAASSAGSKGVIIIRYTKLL